MTGVGTDPARARPGVAASTLQGYAATLGAAAFSLLNVLIVARVLGPEGRGEVAYLNALATLTALVASLSLQEANANFAATYPRLRQALAGNSLVFALGLGSSGIAVVAALAIAVPGVRAGSSVALVAVVLIAVPFIIVQGYLSLLLRADFRIGAANAALLMVPLGAAAANGLLAVAGRLTVELAVISWVIFQAAAALLLLWHVVYRSVGVGPPDRVLARESLSFGVKTHASGVLAFGSFRLDQLLVGSLAGPRELGLYSIAVAWAEVVFYLPSALALVVRPYVVRGTAAEASRRASSAFRATAAATIPLALILVLGAPVLCIGAFGGEFTGSVADLQILAPGTIGVVALKLLGTTLVARGRPLLETIAVGVAFTATTGLDLVLIPPFGGAGAALASSLGYLAAGLATAVIFLRVVGASPWDLVPSLRDLREVAAVPRRLLGVQARLGRTSAIVDGVDGDAPLVSYLWVLRRRALVVVVAVLAAVGASLAVTASDDPVYRARTDLLVGQDGGPFQPGFGNTLEPFTQTVTALLESDAVARRVVDELDLPIGPATLIARLDVTREPDSAVLDVVYDSPTTGESTRVLAAIVGVYNDLVRSTGDSPQGTLTLSSLDEPEDIGRLDSSRMTDILFSALAGLAAGILLAFLWEAASRATRQPGDRPGAARPVDPT